MPQTMVQRAESRKTVPMYAARKAAVSQRYWTATMSMTKTAVIKKRRIVAMSVKSVMAQSWRIPKIMQKMMQKMPAQIRRNVSVRHYARRTASMGTALCAERMMPVS